MIVREWQLLSVSLAKASVQSEIGESLPAKLHARRRDVDALDVGAVPRVMGEDVAVAAADVKHALAGERGKLVNLGSFGGAVDRFAQAVEVREILAAAERMGNRRSAERILVPERAHLFDRDGLHGASFLLRRAMWRDGLMIATVGAACIVN